jgi:hypothetical protein
MLCQLLITELTVNPQHYNINVQIMYTLTLVHFYVLMLLLYRCHNQ